MKILMDMMGYLATYKYRSQIRDKYLDIKLTITLTVNSLISNKYKQHRRNP